MKKRSLIGIIVTFVLIVLLCLFIVNGFSVGVYDVKPLNGIQQGLDLTGGVYTVYQADDTSVENFDQKMEGAMLVLRERLDSKGFTEATITRQGTDKIRVEIPINSSSEIKDPNEVAQFIGTPAKLAFVDPDGNTILEGDQISMAQVQMDNNKQYVVAFELNEEGTKAFAEATKKFLNQTISITIDGEVISSPTVESVISGGKGVINGGTKGFTYDEANNLALQIESGALPLDLSEVEVRSISATLGFNALENSIMAGLIGIAIIFIFMLIVYRIPGLVACMALAVYTCIVMLLLGSVPGVQLTLPGIAGIILGIGMAVDANVIIFERFKEEFRTGKTLRTSFNAGFKKAFVTILDSNVTTLICAIVLAVFGTGQLKSFAYTLIISIVVSMISALLITKGILKMFINLNLKNPNLYMAKAKEIRAAAKAAKEGGTAQ
ncbi:MAG: protein translocase subunit SecD [Christensenella sp.]|nr:protein translocase subunit SecD [Christensenella sp.]